jgi:folate-binding protein YgfZ
MADARQIDWLRQTVGALALPDRAIVSLRGDDAWQWLQGQLTNDVEGLEPGKSVYGFVLTLKGRVMADVWVLSRGDEIWLDVPASEVDALLQRLDRYIIMEDVDLARRPELRLITAQGPKAEEISGEGWPADRLGTGGKVWAVPDVELQSALDRLVTRCRALGGGPITEQAWSDAHVVLGRPRFGVDFGEWTYPQESGLCAAAVSFTKGCYVGQETVMMLQSRGKAPKTLWRWAIEGSEPPPAKAPIAREGMVVGEVTSAARIDGGVAALGFLKRGHETDGGAGFVIGEAPAKAVGPVGRADART